MLLSIIIPCYNSEKFISNTLDMLISQGLEDCEIIVVNDGSTDLTAEIVGAYIKKNSAIRLIDKKNEGVSVARNIGIENAKGQYIYFLDSDDSLSNDTLSIFRNILISNPKNDMYAFGYVSKRDNTVIKEYSAKELNKLILDKSKIIQNFFTKKLPIHICSCIYNREFVLSKKILFTPGVKIGEDVEFILKAVLQANSLYYDSCIYYIYKIRDNSVMQGYKVYNHGNTWLTNKKIIDNYGSSDYETYYNYWLINRYIGKLYAYIRYGNKNIQTENAFLESKYFLYLPTRNYGKIFYLKTLIRIIPLNLIFKILKK